MSEKKKYELNDITPSGSVYHQIWFRENEGPPLKEERYELSISGSKMEGVSTPEGKATQENVPRKDLKLKIILDREEEPPKYPDNPGTLDALDLRDSPEGGKGFISIGVRANEKDTIKKIQLMLKTLNYNIGLSGPDQDGVDGIFGQLTFKALKEFQKGRFDFDEKELQVDGRVGDRTADALNRAMVGKWYNEYRTPKDLRKDKVIITIVASEIQKEYEVKDEG